QHRETNRHVLPAVAVEVAQDDEPRTGSDECQGRLECSITVAEENGAGTHETRAGAISEAVDAHCQILDSVAIEIGNGHGLRKVERKEARSDPKGSIAVAEHHRDRAGPRAAPLVDDREVFHSIAIEVADGHKARTGAGAEARRRPKGSIAVAQEDGDRATMIVRDRQIVHAVTIEVADGHRRREDASRTTTSREGQRLLEGPLTVAEQHRDSSGGRDRQVFCPVAVEVAHDHGPGTVADIEVAWRLEGPVALTKPHGDGVVAIPCG